MNILIYYQSNFASVYGACGYGATDYSATTSCAGSASAASTNSNNGGLLANTGTSVLFFATIACLLIFTALIVRFWRRNRSS